MEPRGTDSGTELVLDNRKLILGFVLLVALCGACFVIGFMEGKRQAIQAKVDSIVALPPAPQPPPDSAAGQGIKTPEKSPAPAAAEDKSVREQLDWYKNVQSGDPAASKAAPATADAARSERTSLGKTPAADQKNAAALPAVSAAGRASYTVQVGAFRQLREAESKAESLKAKGFPSLIETPKTADQFYFVKVGKFASRTEAVAMQRKLTKAGFSCFIKLN